RFRSATVRSANVVLPSSESTDDHAFRRACRAWSSLVSVTSFSFVAGTEPRSPLARSTPRASAQSTWWFAETRSSSCAKAGGDRLRGLGRIGLGGRLIRGRIRGRGLRRSVRRGGSLERRGIGRRRGRVRRRGRLRGRVEQLHDAVARARGERGACEEERREREARGELAGSDAHLLPAVAARQEHLLSLASNHGAQKRQRSREEERVEEALPSFLCPLWHCLAPFVRAPRPPHRRGSLVTSAAATESRRLSASRRYPSHSNGGTPFRIPRPRDMRAPRPGR